MRTNDAFAALDAHQAAVLAAVDLALDLAGRPPEEVRVELAKARWDLVRRARAYQLFKHYEIFDPGIFHGNAAQADVARGMKDACLAAGAVLEEFAVSWAGKDLVAEWPGYRRALTTLADDLRAHVACERRAIATYLGDAPGPRKLSAAA